MRVLEDVKYLLELDYKNCILAPNDASPNFRPDQIFKHQLSYDNTEIVELVKIDFGKLEKKQRKFLDSVPYIGHFNKIPIFIISVDNNMIELILLESYKEKIIL